MHLFFRSGKGEDDGDSYDEKEQSSWSNTV